MARQALASPFIKHMDVEYARLARDLQLPKGISTAPKANVIENATASYKSPNTTAGQSNDVSEIAPFKIVTQIPSIFLDSKVPRFFY